MLHWHFHLQGLLYCDPIKYKAKDSSEAECTNYPDEAESLYDTAPRKLGGFLGGRSDVVTFNSQTSSFLFFFCPF